MVGRISATCPVLRDVYALLCNLICNTCQSSTSAILFNLFSQKMLRQTLECPYYDLFVANVLSGKLLQQPESTMTCVLRTTSIFPSFKVSGLLGCVCCACCHLSYPVRSHAITLPTPFTALRCISVSQFNDHKAFISRMKNHNLNGIAGDGDTFPSMRSLPQVPEYGITNKKCFFIFWLDIPRCAQQPVLFLFYPLSLQ